MTEAEWLAATDAQPMLAFLRDRVSDRKLRLFAVACCRRIWHLLSDDRSRAAVEAAEQYADGSASGEQLRAVSAAVAGVGFGKQFSAANAARFACWPGHVFADRSAFYAARAAAGLGEPAAQAEFLRCICGNPFRPATVNPAWLTLTVSGIAERIYADRAFHRLSVLGDALEDAGCDRADLLMHLRSPGPHVRGCWALDLLLGKS